MLQFKSNDNTTKNYTDLNQLFTKSQTTRKERNTIFGDYITEIKDGESINPEALLTKVKGKLAEYRQYVANLEQLEKDTEDAAAKSKADALTAGVGAMSEEELKALEAAIAKRKAANTEVAE